MLTLAGIVAILTVPLEKVIKRVVKQKGLGLAWFICIAVVSLEVFLIGSPIYQIAMGTNQSDGGEKYLGHLFVVGVIFFGAMLMVLIDLEKATRVKFEEFLAKRAHPEESVREESQTESEHEE